MVHGSMGHWTDHDPRDRLSALTLTKHETLMVSENSASQRNPSTTQRFGSD